MTRRLVSILLMVWLCTACSMLPAKARQKSNRITLFNGKDTTGWQMKDGSACKWPIVGGALEVAPKAGDIYTKQKFTDYSMHIEFRTPMPAPTDKGQHRGNSGIFMQSIYELQILESFGISPPTKGDCGSVYNIKAPDSNVAKPPMQWQAYDITYRAPRFDSSGKKIKNAVISVIWNSQPVHKNVEIPHPTRNANLAEPPGPQPLQLQDHGFKVQFRDIWIVPLEEEKS